MASNGYSSEFEREVANVMRRIEGEAQILMQEMEAETEVAWAVLEAEDDDAQVGRILRSDYVPADKESEYLRRNELGAIELCLVEAGDRLAIWSPRHGGALINPKGRGLPRIGIYTSYIRGAGHHAAFGLADLRAGRPLDMVRQPENPHDANAIALAAPEGIVGFVQRGKVAAVAKRMDRGERLGCVCLRGPGPGDDNDSATVLIASARDLTQLT